jgi:tRNA pseudouridine13 synthase
MDIKGSRSPVQLPYLTVAVPGIGGRIRSEPEDFQVDERPLYLPCGNGEHLYIRVTKRLLSTPDLIRRISSTVGVKVQGIGTAGLKDARAVTTQLVSLQGVPEERVSRLKLDEQILRIEVLGRHRNRLRPGHHAGNRFRLVIRDVNAGAGESIPTVLEELSRRGIPNYFGPQRQGKTGDNFQVGAALLSDPAKRENMSRAKRMWYLNTFQSHLFNEILARRVDRIDRMLVGDWAMKMDNGACFPVLDAVEEQPRADRFEISPTGILFGSRVSWADGEPGEMEKAVVVEQGSTPERLIEAAKACGFRGERRSLRVPLVGPEWTLDGSVFTLAFSLPPGAYATSVLRELMKVPQAG